MKVNLRKANAIQNSINEVLKTIKVETTTLINEFEKPDLKIIDAVTDAVTNFERKDKLLVAQYAIRDLVASVNETAGISKTLNAIVLIEKQMTNLNILVNAKPVEADEVIAGKHAKMKERSSTVQQHSYYNKDEVIVAGIFSEYEIADYKATSVSLRKQKQKLQDALLELNIKNEIELSASIVSVLEKENII